METDNPVTINEKSGYTVSRFNAVKHGILSKEAVLPHESGKAFEELLNGLIAEYSPQTQTEEALVDELATVIWRKRRLLNAENARINDTLSRILNRPEMVLNSASPLHLHIHVDELPFREILSLDEAGLAKKSQENTDNGLLVSKALNVLKAGGRNAARNALQVLPERILDWWDICPHYQEKQYHVRQFLLREATQKLKQERMLIDYVEEIRKQATGYALNGDNLMSFARYEAHLDRKFERTLSMLIKLKSMRSMNEE